MAPFLPPTLVQVHRMQSLGPEIDVEFLHFRAISGRADSD